MSYVERTLRGALPILGALSLCACLSIDRINHYSDPPPDGFDDELDGGSWEAADAQADVETPEDGGLSDDGGQAPCVDRGAYKLDDVPVEGMPASCEGDLACIEGRCVPLPSCEAGVWSECRFTPQGVHSTPVDFAMQGDYVYWVEPGSFDELQQYRGNGVLARAQVGKWQREEVVHDLDFYDDAQGQLADPIRLTAHERYITATMPKRSIAIAPDGNVFAFAHASGGWPECIVDSNCYTMGQSGPAWLDLTGQYSEQPIGDGSLPPGHCEVASNDKVYWTDENGALWRIELAGGYAEHVVGAPQEVVGATSDRLVGMLNGWVATAPIHGWLPLTWRMISGGGLSYVVGSPSLRAKSRTLENDDVVWARTGASRSEAVVLRTLLGASQSPQVVAEIPELVGVEAPSFRLFAAGPHLMWRVGRTPWLHYARTR